MAIRVAQNAVKYHNLRLLSIILFVLKIQTIKTFAKSCIRYTKIVIHITPLLVESASCLFNDTHTNLHQNPAA